MNDNSSGGKMSSMQFHSVNAKGNWANSAEKNLQPGVKITTVFRLSWKCLNLIIIKTF